MNASANIFVSSTDLARLDAMFDALPTSSSPELAALRAELDRATVVDPRELPPTVVTMNSTVRFVIEPDGREFELTLVYPRDMDGQPGKISVIAPVGSALLGLSVGQWLDWPLPDGRKTTVRIIEVTNQPEEAGDYHR